MYKYYLPRMITDAIVEIYGPLQIATNDAGSYMWLIWRPIREYVTWYDVTPV